MKNLFNSVKMTRPKRNVFDLTHDVKLSFNMGQLIPVCVLECVPGDKFKIGCTSLLRFAPLISPVMHRMDVTVHYFFVPNRITWPGWEKFIVGENDPDVPPVQPFIEIEPTDWANGSLADYLGIPKPTTDAVSIKFNALAFAAYWKIYDDYYRDQNLIPATWEPLDDGNNTSKFTAGGNLGKLRLRAWEHDYFTASLPFAQKGAAVQLPLGEFTDVPVMINDSLDTVLTGTPLPMDVDRAVPVDPDNNIPVHHGFAQTSVLTDSSTTINDLRRAIQLQRWLEKNALGGTRYIESILNHFGVRSSDKRLQRPEYIVGTKAPVIISEIVNTTGTDALPQGNMSGHGMSVQSGKSGTYFCEEHGFIIGIMSVMPKTAYQDGMNRHFMKYGDQFDYFWPEFANIGEQEVKIGEVYAWQNTDNNLFGYVPRYAEYKFMPSRVAGDFRDNLSFWHLGRIFSSTPALNKTFIECVPRDDIFAVIDPDVQKMYCHFLNQITAIRPMPKYGTPSGL